MITMIPNLVSYKIECDRCKKTVINAWPSKPADWQYVEVSYGTGYFDHATELHCKKCSENR